MLHLQPFITFTCYPKRRQKGSCEICRTSTLHKVILKLQFFLTFFLLQGQSITGSCQNFYMYPSHRSWLGTMICFSATAQNSCVYVCTYTIYTIYTYTSIVCLALMGRVCAVRGAMLLASPNGVVPCVNREGWDKARDASPPCPCSVL